MASWALHRKKTPNRISVVPLTSAGAAAGTTLAGRLRARHIRVHRRPRRSVLLVHATTTLVDRPWRERYLADEILILDAPLIIRARSVHLCCPDTGRAARRDLGILREPNRLVVL